MSICSYCYETNKVCKIEVGHWWNNEPYLGVVCSEDCKKKLWELVQNGTWMEHAPFITKKRKKPKSSVPSALTDKQFTKHE